jgi:CubicO group peptidase (beta-lactamase class C family)
MPTHTLLRRTDRTLALLVLVAATITGCAAPRRLTSNRPIEGWVIAEPSEVGMDAVLLRAAAARLDGERKHGIDSMLVVRRGRIVAEHYWHGHDMATLHDLRSATKSVTSLLVGIALERGLMKDVGDPVMGYLGRVYPEFAGESDDPPITLEHLLTMRSGRACDDRDPRSPGQEDTMYKSRDWVRFFLALPRAYPPGERTQYCTGGVVTLGRVVAEAAGTSIGEFSARYLFGPLGVRTAAWRRFDGDRQTDTGGHLYLRPRAMAKIGQLVLQRGVWDGEDIVSGAWIDASTAVHTRFADDDRPYGYLWWRAQARLGARNVDVIFADGNGGQYIFVVPALDLVVVFTGHSYNDPAAARPFAILGQYILPAALATAAAPKIAD